MWNRRRQTITLLLITALCSFVMLMPVTVSAQDEDSSTRTAQFEGHIFEFPRTMADGFSAFVIDQSTEYLSYDDFLYPPRTEFRLMFYSDTAAFPMPVSVINAYAISDLEGYAVRDQYERLRDLLNTRPDLSGEQSLPTLYPYHASALPPDRYTEVFMNAAYIDSAGYRGITFIYGRIISLGDRPAVMFYRVYFEGISLDDQRYLSAQVEGLPELIESLDGITDLSDYITAAQTLFNEPTDEAVLAWLRQANMLFSSFDYAAQP